MRKKRKRSDDDQVESLEVQIRELKQENRSLHQKIRKLNKGYYRLRDDDKIEDKDIPKEVKLCWDCGTGEYRKVCINNRQFRRCQECGKTGKVTVLSE